MSESNRPNQTLLEEFEIAKNKEYCLVKNRFPKVPLLAWQPQLMFLFQEERTEKLNIYFKQWSAKWLKEKGYKMIVIDEAIATIKIEPNENHMTAKNKKVNNVRTNAKSN